MMAPVKDENRCNRLLKTIKQSYETLHKIAKNPRYTDNLHSKKIRTGKKALILKATLNHIKFLENTLKNLIQQKVSNEKSSLTLLDYQQKFAQEMRKKFSKCLSKKKRGTMQYCVGEDDFSATMTLSNKTDECEMQNTILFSQSPAVTPKTEFIKEISKSDSEESQNTLEEVSKQKPKCCKNLEKEFSTTEIKLKPNEVEDFNGFYEFYKTIADLLGQVIPISIISTECSRNFILNIWSELSKDQQIKFVAMAPENENKEEILEDNSQKQNSLCLFQDNELFPEGEGSLDMLDLPDLDLSTNDFDLFF